MTGNGAAGVHGPGSPIADGFTVQQGSQLQGIPFVPVAGPGRSHVWLAVLKITGDPVQVADRYLQQARRLGLAPSFEAFPGGCSAHVRTDRGVLTRPLDSTEGPVQAVTCSLYYDRRTSNGKNGASWSLDLRVGDGDADERSFASAVIRYSITGNGRGSDAAMRPALRRISGRTPHIEPWKLPPVPTDNDRIDAGISSGLTRGVTVVPGSQMVDVAADNEACATGGFFAVLSVTGDGEEILRAYGRQFAANGFTQFADTTRRISGNLVHAVAYEEAGAGELWAELVAQHGSERWLLLGRCND